MDLCGWLKPRLVAQIGIREWTRDGHLRHLTFLGAKTKIRDRLLGCDGVAALPIYKSGISRHLDASSGDMRSILRTQTD